MSNPKVAIITLMRKGSKRLPGKNKLPFRGKPLYRHTVDFAVELSKEIGAPYYLLHDYDDIPDIPGCTQITGLPNFGGDVHNTSENIKDSRINADDYILLQVTSPIRDLNFLISEFKSWMYIGWASAYSCYELPDGIYITKSGKNYIMDDRGYGYIEKQPVYKETGSFYFFKKEELEYKHFLYNEYKSTIVTDKYNIDINTKEDYERLIKEYGKS